MSKKRAFVRYTKAGKLVPGSLVITDGTHPDGPATWREITFDKCCDDNNGGCCGPNVILQTNLNWYCANPYVDNIYANSDNAGIFAEGCDAFLRFGFSIGAVPALPSPDELPPAEAVERTLSCKEMSFLVFQSWMTQIGGILPYESVPLGGLTPATVFPPSEYDSWIGHFSLDAAENNQEESIITLELKGCIADQILNNTSCTRDDLVLSNGAPPPPPCCPHVLEYFGPFDFSATEKYMIFDIQNTSSPCQDPIAKFTLKYSSDGVNYTSIGPIEYSSDLTNPYYFNLIGTDIIIGNTYYFKVDVECEDGTITAGDDYVIQEVALGQPSNPVP